jgi:hypothetical protein
MTQPRTTNNGAYRHSPGDGFHHIAVDTLQDGRDTDAGTSDICIVANAQILCSAFGLPPFWVLWSEAYPDDPMTAADLVEITNSALPYMVECDPLIAETREMILRDLRAIKCDALAEKIEQLLIPFTKVEDLLKKKETPN